MPVANDSQILDAIENRIKTLAWVKKVESEEIKLEFSEIHDHEVPYVQIYDNGQSITHQRGEILVDWQIAVELALKSSSTSTVNMRTLLDKRQEIEQVIGAQPNLGIAGVIHVLYLQNTPDLNLVRPFYTTTLLFSVQYRKKYVSEC
jgi:hypothetical protein